MTKFQKFITTAFYLFWAWRVCSFVYSSYAVSEAVTPSDIGAMIKGGLMICLIAASMILHATPLRESPHFSLAKTIVSIPSQVHTIIFLHKYVVPTFDSTKFTILIHFLSAVSVMETIYLIYVDLQRIE